MKKQNIIATIKICFATSISLLLFSSCFVKAGKFVDGNCRPKKSNFKLLKIPFDNTDRLKFNRVYTLNNVFKNGIGFYNDGRLLLLENYNDSTEVYDDLTDGFVKLRNWDNAETIGYWRVNQNKIKTENFNCGNSGFYTLKQGEIIGDTIIFYKNVYSPTPPYKEIRLEKYILSQISF